MGVLVYFIVFVFGLIIGSFLNCVIYRLALPKGRPRRSRLATLRGRSFCPHCRHILSWQDLIPVFSFLILKGKCRYCHQKISLQYPIVEISTGLIFLLIFNFQFSIFNFQNLITTCFMLCVSCFMIVIFVYDLKHYIIPDKVIYPAIVLALIFNFQQFGPELTAEGFSMIKFSILSAIGAAAFFLAIVLISRGQWMGIGDIKLAFFMGLFLSFPNILVALFLSFFIGAIIGIVLITARKKTLKSEVPFGPFLVIGTFLALFWGSELINWYQGLFLI